MCKRGALFFGNTPSGTTPTPCATGKFGTAGTGATKTLARPVILPDARAMNCE
jgi:hypothetical protein